MTKFDLIKTLSYYGQETTVEGDFIIGEDTIWASQKIVAQIFKLLHPTYPCISQISYRTKS